MPTLALVERAEADLTRFNKTPEEEKVKEGGRGSEGEEGDRRGVGGELEKGWRECIIKRLRGRMKVEGNEKEGGVSE